MSDVTRKFQKLGKSILFADASLVNEWGVWLDDALGGKTPIGICWRTEFDTKIGTFSDQINTPKDLNLLRANDQIALVSLVEDVTVQERMAIPNLIVPNPYGERVSLDDINALMVAIHERGGRVVATDTALPQLAGALGVRTTLLLSTNPNEKWGQEGEKIKHYPSMTILRQSTQGDWESVLTEAASRFQAETTKSKSTNLRHD